MQAVKVTMCEEEKEEISIEFIDEIIFGGKIKNDRVAALLSTLKQQTKGELNDWSIVSM